MQQRKCGSMRGTWGGMPLCTPHEVARMSFTINEALRMVLNDAVAHAIVQSVACSGPL